MQIRARRGDQQPKSIGETQPTDQLFEDGDGAANEGAAGAMVECAPACLAHEKSACSDVPLLDADFVVGV